jgi:hypothetical protein
VNQWIITAGGDAVAIDTNIVDFTLARPELFGLTADDCAFVRQKIAANDVDVWDALLTRLLVVGIAVECSMGIVGPTGEPVMAPTAAGAPQKIIRRGWRHMGSMSPPSPLTPGQELRDEDDPTMFMYLDDVEGLFVFFHLESHPMWKRLIKWLETAPVELNINAKTVVTLKEWETTRGWSHLVEAIFRDYHISKNPKRGGNCNRCGRMVSWDEMIEKISPAGDSICPYCGMPLG